MDAFLAIEKILKFHHLTTRHPMRLSQLRFRAFQNGTSISQQNITEIIQIWPEAYKIYALKGQTVIEALDLPLRAEERQKVFYKLWSAKENAPEQPRKSVDNTEANITTPEKRQALRPILMGRLRSQMHMNCNMNNSKLPLNLLDRIRAKEARLKTERTPQALKANRDAFLRSQVPKLTRVLSDLIQHQTHKSLDMDTAMHILRTNLFRLSDEEISRTLKLAAQMYPTFCSIVKVGETEHLKLKGESVGVF